MILYLNKTPHAAYLRVNEELTIFEKKRGMGFCNKTWRNKGKLLYKKGRRNVALNFNCS
jgi:hypothetical protein